MHPHDLDAFNLPPPRVNLKRKIRRGTRSCWECKRRKVRCSLIVAKTLTCDGCQRWKTVCVSQEFPNYYSKTEEDQSLSGRLDQLERVLEGLAQEIGTRDQRNFDNYPQQTRLWLRHARTSVSQWSAISRGLDFKGSDDLSNLCRMLIKAWPNQRDLSIILNLPGETSTLFHGTICASTTTVQSTSTPSLKKILGLSCTPWHPVLIAKKLLTLASYLQNLSPACTQQLDEADVNYRELMQSAFHTAQNYVTCNDDLLDSLEGIECVMIESMYQNNAGNLQRAWHIAYRAIQLAQRLGLDRSISLDSFKVLEIESKARIRPDYMWFRLIQTNRYLSMMLGLAQGTVSNGFADAHVLMDCSPRDQMQRIDCAAGGYVLQRNEEGLFDKATTRMIDQMLQRSADCMPASWWLIPSVNSDTDSLGAVLQMIDQLAHYHIINQLHLPLVIRPDPEHVYSRMMALDACREVLARFTSMRHAHAFTSFCRGISMLAFNACLTICVVHMNARRELDDQNCDGRDDYHCNANLYLLASQHRKDRAMMELTLETMEHIAREIQDAVACKTIPVLKNLLVMEAIPEMCTEYIPNQATTNNEPGLGCGGRLDNGGTILYVHVPHIGTVKFERRYLRSSASHAARPSLVGESGLPGVPIAPYLPDPSLGEIRVYAVLTYTLRSLEQALTRSFMLDARNSCRSFGR